MKNLSELLQELSDAFYVQKNEEQILEGLNNEVSLLLESKSINLYYRELLDFRKSLNDISYIAALKYEPAASFVITHYSLLGQDQIVYVITVILKIYAIVESQGDEEFSGINSLFDYIIKLAYREAESDKWNLSQHTAIDSVLEYVYESLLKRKIFDGYLFCGRILFSKRSVFLKELLRITNPVIIDQIVEFFTDEFEFKDLESLKNPQKMLSEICNIFFLSEIDREKMILKEVYNSNIEEFKQYFDCLINVIQRNRENTEKIGDFVD